MQNNRDDIVLETDKTFFKKITNTIGKLLIPTKVGFNSVMISIKRNNVIKAYLYNEEDKDETSRKNTKIHMHCI